MNLATNFSYHHKNKAENDLMTEARPMKMTEVSIIEDNLRHIGWTKEPSKDTTTQQEPTTSTPANPKDAK